MKRGFVTPLRVESIDSKTWRILTPLRWVGWKGDVFEVEPGEITDFATVPWWSQFILPRTGTWTKAAVLHDKMCNQLREFYRQQKAYYQWAKDFRAVGGDVAGLSDEPKPPKPPVFSSNDADAIFRKNAREEGTDLIRAELLWFGVRCGSLWDAHRRAEWVRTLPRFTFDLLWILGLLVAIVAGISWAWPW